MRQRKAFTLIELLMVVVIIGILAAIAIPSYKATKERAYAAQLKSDLRNLTTAQESYYFEHGYYATSALALYPVFSPTAGVTLTVVQTVPDGWSAKATTTSTAVTCALYYNTPPLAPATADGIIGCQ